MMNTTFTDYCAGLVLTNEELKRLHTWVDDGNSFENNPWMMTDENGKPLDFVTAWRTMLELEAEHEPA